MRSRQVAWCIGVVGLLSACSGKYEVGHNTPDSAGNGGAPSYAGAGDVFTAGAPNAKGGSPSYAGAGDVFTAGAPNAKGGSPSYAGAFSQGGSGEAGGGNTVTPISFCGTQFPPTVDGTLHKSAVVVLNRVRQFVAGSDAANAPDPIDTTSPLRTQAAHYATQLLDYYGTGAGSQSAPGMTRFVETWLPGTHAAETWSAFFRTSTLTQLMTSPIALKGGSGVLTDLAVLGLPDSNGNGGITMRGAFLSKHLLCRAVADAPANIAALGPQPPNVTRREQLQSTVIAPTCRACHALSDDLGFSLEHFDRVGAISDIDHGKPVDSSGVFTTPSGSRLEFSDASDLASQLAQNCDVAICLTRQLLSDARAASNLPPLADDSEVVSRLAYEFGKTTGRLRELVTLIAESDALQQ